MKLLLRLKQPFFDQILSGQKTTEYRDNSDYWRKRIIGKDITEIEFVNGYGKSRPRMIVECRNQCVNFSKQYICLHLGKIISSKAAK